MAEGRFELADTKQPYIDSFGAVNNTIKTPHAGPRDVNGLELRKSTIDTFGKLSSESVRFL